MTAAGNGGTADWLTDSSLSREETLRRFEALGPEATTGPDGSGGVTAEPCTCRLEAQGEGLRRVYQAWCRRHGTPRRREEGIDGA